MANLKLKKIVSSRKAKMIETSDNCMVLGYTEPGVSTENDFKIYDYTAKEYLGGIYPSEQFEFDYYIKNPEYDSGVLVDIEVTDSPGKWTKTSQFNDTAISLKPAIEIDVSYTLDSDNPSNQFTERGYITLYKPYSSTSDLDEDYFNNLENVDSYLSGMIYSSLSDQPLNGQYYDFDKGKVFTRSFKLKNFYDTEYQINSLIDRGSIPSNFRLFNTRKYKKVGVNNQEIWISYTSKTNYQGTIDGFVGDGQVIPISESGENSGGHYEYEFLERIESFNSINNRLHKSNVYSIRVKDTGLNENISDDSIRNLIQENINKSICEVVEKIAPAYCQLWKIEWKGK
jgi:hypothetical protein